MALAIALPSVLPLGFGILTHISCGTGSVVASAVLWTPRLLLNSPYLGSAWANSSGWGVGPLTNGSSVGVFSLEEWNLSPRQDRTVLGSGVDAPCAGGWAVNATARGGLVSYSLGHPLVASDAQEIGNFSMTDWLPFSADYGQNFSSVYFQNGLPNLSDRTVSTCGGPSAQLGASSSGYPVTVPFEVGPAHVLVATTVLSPVAYSYGFPADAGVWPVFTGGSPGAGSLGGWAFGYAPCAGGAP